jgi:hypothetical protein
MAAARYRLQVVVEGVNEASAELDGAVNNLWSRYHISHESSAVITPQERRMAMYETFLRQPWIPGLANGMYNPLEDTVYVPDIAQVGTPRGSFLVRHETAHLVGGGERLRQAFMRRFGARWLEWWDPFNEGMAELVAVESLPPGTSPPPAGEVEVQPGLIVSEQRYENYLQWVQQMTANPEDAALVRRAYFTGEVDEHVYELLARARGAKLPPAPR